MVERSSQGERVRRDENLGQIQGLLYVPGGSGLRSLSNVTRMDPGPNMKPDRL